MRLHFIAHILYILAIYINVFTVSAAATIPFGSGNNIIRIGTRGSPLALVQAHSVKSLFEKKFPNRPIIIKEIMTKGDKILDQVSKVK